MLQQINHFKILKQIGKGGSETVYKAFDIRLKRNVAIKVIHPNPNFQEEDLHRFLVEARSASSINHPNQKNELEEELRGKYKFESIIGHHPKMVEILKLR